MTTITLAGVTGDLGKRILQELVKRGANVNAIVRPGKDTSEFTKMGAKVIVADFNDTKTLSTAMQGTQTVVSALAGTHEVIVEAQTALLKAAVEAKVPRIIPSDYSIDYTLYERGRNRNSDWKRDYWNAIEAEPSIKATGIFNGAFDYIMKSPFIVDSQNQVIHYWGEDENIHLDYSSLDNVAAYTAQAAMDTQGPTRLRIASVTVTPLELAQTASKVTGKSFKTQSSGSLEKLRGMIKQMKEADPTPNQNTLPPWQALQYAENMFSGFGSTEKNDNARYSVQWTTIEEMLAHLKA